MNRVQASSWKALINLSNTACGTSSDEKLRQLPGAPGDTKEPPGAFYGNLVEISMKIIDSRWFTSQTQWEINDFNCFSMEIQWTFSDVHCIPMEMQWKSWVSIEFFPGDELRPWGFTSRRGGSATAGLRPRSVKGKRDGERRNFTDSHWNFMNPHCRFTESHSISLKLHAESPNDQGVSWDFMELHSDFMESHRKSMRSHETSLELHGIPSIIYGISWNYARTSWNPIENLWHVMKLHSNFVEFHRKPMESHQTSLELHGNRLQFYRISWGRIDLAAESDQNIKTPTPGLRKTRGDSMISIDFQWTFYEYAMVSIEFQWKFNRNHAFLLILNKNFMKDRTISLRITTGPAAQKAS